MSTALKLDRQKLYTHDTRHQRISMKLCAKLGSYLDGKKCELFAAPFDVRLNVDGANDVVVQPDLLVVCDPEKIDDKGCNGAPDLVVEILSLSNATYDTMTKFQIYREARVSEIWFVDPETTKTQVSRLENGKYTLDFYDAEDVVPVGILPGFELNMKDIF